MRGVEVILLMHSCTSIHDRRRNWLSGVPRMPRSLSDTLIRKSGQFPGHSLLGTLTSQNGRSASVFPVSSVSIKAVAIDMADAWMMESLGRNHELVELTRDIGQGGQKFP